MWLKGFELFYFNVFVLDYFNFMIVKCGDNLVFYHNEIVDSLHIWEMSPIGDSLACAKRQKHKLKNGLLS